MELSCYDMLTILEKCLMLWFDYAVFQAPISEKSAMPTMPVPWNSVGEPECWAWSSNIFVIQKDPITLMERDAKAAKKKIAKDDVGIRHKFAVSVFKYSDIDQKNVKKSMPYLIYTVEQGYYGAMEAEFAKNKGKAPKKGADKGWGDPLFCSFYANGHANYGEYKSPITKDGVRKHLFDMLKEKHKIASEPVKIGAVSKVVKFMKDNPVIADTSITQDSKPAIQPTPKGASFENVGIGLVVICLTAVLVQRIRGKISCCR